MSSVYTLTQREQGENHDDSPLPQNLISRIFAFPISFANSSHSLLNKLQWVLTEWHDDPIVSYGETTFSQSTIFRVFWWPISFCFLNWYEQLCKLKFHLFLPKFIKRHFAWSICQNMNTWTRDALSVLVIKHPGLCQLQ